MGIFEEIANFVVEGNKEAVVSAINKALAQHADPIDIIQKGLTQGISIVGDKFKKMEMYLPEMLISAETMKAGVKIVEPSIKKGGMKEEGVVVIGTVLGDVHDIGKNIVTFYLGASGFKVYDLGSEVPPYEFVEQAVRKEADIIGVSALLTSTMAYIPDIIGELERRGLRDKYIVMVGGGAVTPDWASKVGADGTGADFAEAAKVAKQLMKAKRAAKCR